MHRGPRVYLDCGKINIMESLGSGGAGCAVTTWSRNRALLDVIEKSCTTLLNKKLMSNEYIHSSVMYSVCRQVRKRTAAMS